MEPIAAARAGGAPSATTKPNDHQFGGGLRIGGLAFGVGGSVRYFFYGGPLGVQGEVTHYRLNLGNREWSSLQFSPAVIYRFVEQKLDGPVSLTPYAGGGLSFIQRRLRRRRRFFEEVLGLDDTSVGVFLFGGVEIFFGGCRTWASAASCRSIPTTTSARRRSAPRSPGAAHWYFW